MGTRPRWLTQRLAYQNQAALAAIKRRSHFGSGFWKPWTSRTPPLVLSIKASSAPVKTSCQRKPSVTMRKTFFVFSGGLAALAGERKSRQAQSHQKEAFNAMAKGFRVE